MDKADEIIIMIYKLTNLAFTEGLVTAEQGKQAANAHRYARMAQEEKIFSAIRELTRKTPLDMNELNLTAQE